MYADSMVGYQVTLNGVAFTVTRDDGGQVSGVGVKDGRREPFFVGRMLERRTRLDWYLGRLAARFPKG